MWQQATRWILTVCVVSIAIPTLGADSTPPGEGWVSLFNGRDLTGWRVPKNDGGHWKVLDGVIDNNRLPGIPAKGPIGLQHHGGRNKKTGKFSPASSLIEFRNVYVKKL